MFRRDVVANCDRISSLLDPASSKVANCDIKDSNSSARKLKCEISREALFVAPKSLIESSRRNAIYARKLGIQHDLLIANRQNSDVRSFVSHSSNRRILSFAPVHSSRRYQLFVDYSQDAVSICDLIFHIRRRVATMTVPLNNPFYPRNPRSPQKLQGSLAG